MHNLCKGCSTSDNVLFALVLCDHAPIKEDGSECPCTICLIKVNCSLVCDELLSFYNVGWNTNE